MMNTKNDNKPNNVKDGGDTIDSVPLYSKKRIMVPLLIAATVIVAGAILLYVNSMEYLSTDDAYVDGNKVTISSKYTGRISQINADEGSSVQNGQVLVQLDASDLNAQKEQSKAAVRTAEESYRLSEINLAKAEDDFKRAATQFKAGIISREQYEHTQKAYESAQAQKALAGTQIASSRAQLGVIDTQLGNISITAPIDGVVAKRWAMPGDVVQMAQPVLSVYDLKHLWVTANFEETKYARIRLGQKAVISLDAYPGKKFAGKVIALGSSTASQFSLIASNNAAGNFTKVTQRIPIKISIDGIDKNGMSEQYPLLPGMSLEVKLRVK